MTEAEFRTAYPAFANTPLSAVSYWLGVAPKFVDASRWGDLAELGVGLFAAHWLALSTMDANAAAGGNVAGGAVGLLASKSVGGVSFAYDTNSVVNADAGMWNQTSYGRRYWQLSRMFGGGGIQL